MTGVVHGGAQDGSQGSPAGAVVLVAAEGSVAPLFDRESLAEYLRLSTDTVDRLVKAGRLPCVRIGSQVRFTLADVDAFIARHRQTGAIRFPRGANHWGA